MQELFKNTNYYCGNKRFSIELSHSYVANIIARVPITETTNQNHPSSF